MHRPRVYIETTIPSAYHEQRTTPELVERRRITREWWEYARESCELVTGSLVLEELGNGPANRNEPWLALVRDLPVLSTPPEVFQIAKAYTEHRLMPRRGEDAVHLALASYHECDYLVSWDCQHLANEGKTAHVRNLNKRLELFVPVILTPLAFLGRLQ